MFQNYTGVYKPDGWPGALITGGARGGEEEEVIVEDEVDDVEGEESEGAAVFQA